jgi:hypothetical protein
MRLCTQVDTLVNQLGGVSRYNPVKGLGSWLTPDLYRIGGAPGYKAVGRAHIYDRTTINTIKLPSCLYAPPVNLDNN